MAEYMGMNPPGLSSSPYLDEAIGILRRLHLRQQFLRLTLDTLHQQLVALGDPVALQNGFSQPAQYASFDSTKPQPVDQQGSGLPDDVILEDEVLWLAGLFRTGLFQREEWRQPLAQTREAGRALMQDGAGGGLPCRHGVVLLRITYHASRWRAVPEMCPSGCSSCPGQSTARILCPARVVTVSAGGVGAPMKTLGYCHGQPCSPLGSWLPVGLLLGLWGSIAFAQQRDLAEVTHREYHAFLLVTGRVAPDHGDGTGPLPTAISGIICVLRAFIQEVSLMDCSLLLT
jgi:hypothetical protein